MTGCELCLDLHVYYTNSEKYIDIFSRGIISVLICDNFVFSLHFAFSVLKDSLHSFLQFAQQQNRIFRMDLKAITN